MEISSNMVSIVALVISSGSLFVSLKSHLRIVKNRMNDKIQDLRINVVELNVRVRGLISGIPSLVNDIEIRDKMLTNVQGLNSELNTLDVSFENFDIKMSDKSLTNGLVKVHKMKKEISLLEEKLKKLQLVNK